jgi:parallel beta-helix repeat protein
MLWVSGSLAVFSQTPSVVVPTEPPSAPSTVPTQTPPPVEPTPVPTQTPPSIDPNPAPVQTLPSATPPATSQPAVSSLVVYVNPASGSDRADAGQAATTPFKTIAYALQQSVSGTTIQLAPGTYSQETGETFPVRIKPGVILRGDEVSKGQSIQITGSGPYTSKTFATQLVTILAASGTEIRGVTVTNPASRGSGVWVEDVNPIVANSTFINSGREGVFVTGSSAPSITDNLFTKNGGNGISVAKSARGEIKGNTFLDTGFGLAIGGTSAPIVENNQINQNKAGIYINDNARPVLRNNVITDNLGDGVVATISAQPDLGTEQASGNNTIRNNKGFDLNNSTGSNVLVAIGNNIDPKRISGKVTFVASTGNVAFQDIQGHWAQAYIQALAARNVITGFPDGTFKPSDPVTRAQFATIIAKAFTPAPRRAATNFSDVAKSFWGYGAIQTAAQGGFMAGYPGGTFSPEQKIPRVQVLVAIANGLEFGAGDVSGLSRFQDATTIPSYASTAVAAALSRQVVVNYPTVTQLSPNREATRAEVAAFVYQALVNAGKAQAISSPYIVMSP